MSQTHRQVNTACEDRFLKNALSILPAYMEMKWASIVDTRKMRPEFVYPECAHDLDLLEDILSTRRSFRQKRSDLGVYTSYKEDEHANLVYLTINRKYALIVNIQADIPITPAKLLCEHVKNMLNQLLKRRHEKFKAAIT